MAMAEPCATPDETTPDPPTESVTEVRVIDGLRYTRAGVVLTIPAVKSRDGMRVEVRHGDRWEAVSPDTLTYLPASGAVTALRGPDWSRYRRVRVTEVTPPVADTGGADG